jgi:dUTP pyrophosphatase
MMIKIKQLPNGKHLPLPSYATEGSAGMDLMAAIEAPVTLASMQRQLIPTGIAIALPNNYEAQIRPRSGLALKHGITCLNPPGTIDSDYRGEICVLLINLSDQVFTVEPAMRIAQMVIAPCIQAEVQLVEDLDETIRGEGGFGSTGMKIAEVKN